MLNLNVSICFVVIASETLSPDKKMKAPRLRKLYITSINSLSCICVKSLLWAIVRDALDEVMFIPVFPKTATQYLSGVKS